MHMPEIQSVLNEKNISFSYVEEDYFNMEKYDENLKKEF